MTPATLALMLFATPAKIAVHVYEVCRRELLDDSTPYRSAESPTDWLIAEFVHSSYQACFHFIDAEERARIQRLREELEYRLEHGDPNRFEIEVTLASWSVVGP